jgi:hypothetical protein
MAAASFFSEGEGEGLVCSVTEGKQIFLIAVRRIHRHLDSVTAILLLSELAVVLVNKNAVM